MHAHTVEDVATVVRAVGTVQKGFKDGKQKENYYKFQIRKTIETMNLLGIMLDRISQSKNQDLIDDVNEMELPKKLERIVSWFENNRPSKILSETKGLDQIMAETEMCHEQLKSLIMVNSVSAV
ncbi:unnamed protein product [Caenorhabditis nigoni]